MHPSPPDEAPAGGFLAFAGARLTGSGLALRAATEGDAGLVAAIYAATREEELRAVSWSAEEKKAFTDWQSGQQEAHYGLHYPAAERLIVERGSPIGRIYVDTTLREARLMEVTLLPEFRGSGIGTRLLDLFLAYADARGVAASLHVEPFNPARRMYLRAGFEVVETRGLYEFMVRPARG